MSETKERFSSRKGLPGVERQNAVQQAKYDTVDRMVTLIGDITFTDYFTQPFSELIPRILPNVELAASYGLIDHPDEVRECLERLQRCHGEHSFRSMAVYMTDEDARLSRDYYSSSYKLIMWHGVHIPFYYRDPLENEPILQAMNAVIEHAGDLTYRDKYTMRDSKDLRIVKQVLHTAAENLLIFEMLPGFCCNGTMCVKGTPQSSCTPVSGGCNLGATQCLGGTGK